MEATHDLVNHWELLAPNVYQCRLAFLDVTVGLVIGRAGVALVDCGTTSREAEGIAADVCHLAGRDVSHVIMTHSHFDHILGAAGFPRARWFCCPEVLRALREDAPRLERAAVAFGAAEGEVAATISQLLVPETADGEGEIDVGDRLITLRYLGAGHTDHDLVALVHPAERGDRMVVFCGDLIEESGPLAVDEASDVERWPVTLEALVAAGGDDAVYVPGHGRAVDADFVRAQRARLVREYGLAEGPEEEMT